MKSEIVYRIQWPVFREYFSKYYPNISMFTIEINEVSKFVNSKLFNFFFVGILFLILIRTQPGTYEAVLIMMHLFMWGIVYFFAKSSEKENFAILKLLINDPRCLKANITRSYLKSGPDKRTRPFAQSFFQVLAQLASSEGYTPNLHKRVKTFQKFGQRKLIQRASIEYRVNGIPMIKEKEYVPWKFEIIDFETPRARFLSILDANVNKEDIEKALARLWKLMLQNEYDLIKGQENLMQRYFSLLQWIVDSPSKLKRKLVG